MKSIKDTKQKEIVFIFLYFHFRKSPLPEARSLQQHFNYFLIVNQFRKTFSAVTDHVLLQHRQVAPWTVILGTTMKLKVLLIPLLWSKGYWGSWKTLICQMSMSLHQSLNRHSSEKHCFILPGKKPRSVGNCHYTCL